MVNLDGCAPANGHIAVGDVADSDFIAIYVVALCVIVIDVGFVSHGVPVWIRCLGYLGKDSESSREMSDSRTGHQL